MDIGVKKIYAVFEGNRILRMSKNKEELIKYRNSFPDEEKRKMFIAEKIVTSAEWLRCE